MLLIATQTAISVFLYVILQEATTRMVDCNKGAQDSTMQQPTKILMPHCKGASNHWKSTKLPQ
jgi:hypothetical protein